MDSYDQLINCGRGAIVDAAMKFRSVLRTHERALVSVSGGADSDVMLDMCERVRGGTGCEVAYAWFDTGIEYAATKRHVAWLEARYGVTIHRHRAERTIPVCCREFGQPFFSKFVSEAMERLQRHGFGWTDEPLDVLMERHPRCRSALRWWCDGYTRTGKPGYYDIGSAPYLKEFILRNPPAFRISAKCCEWAKKRVSRRVVAEGGYDVRVIGIRKAEGGIRAKTADARCFRKGPVDSYYPLFWMTDADRAEYERMFGVRHSDCYELWGFRRTGCVGCPYNRRLERDLRVSQGWEPGVANVARRVFADAYEYTRMYHEFRARMRAEERGQMMLPLEDGTAG